MVVRNKANTRVLNVRLCFKHCVFLCICVIFSLRKGRKENGARDLGHTREWEMRMRASAAPSLGMNIHFLAHFTACLPLLRFFFMTGQHVIVDIRAKESMITVRLHQLKDVVLRFFKTESIGNPTSGDTPAHDFSYATVHVDRIGGARREILVIDLRHRLANLAQRQTLQTLTGVPEAKIFSREFLFQPTLELLPASWITQKFVDTEAPTLHATDWEFLHTTLLFPKLTTVCDPWIACVL